MRALMNYAPDWAWYLYLWTTNERNARKRYPNPFKYLAWRYRIRKIARSC